MQPKKTAGSIRSKVFIVASILLFWYLFAIALPYDRFDRLIKEDGIIETLTAGLFLLTAVAFFLLFISSHHLFPTGIKSHFKNAPRRYFFFLLALIFFFGFGEEISWGQRLFEYETPEYFEEKNTQQELTIHNLEFFDGKDVEGSPKATLRRLFTMKQLFLYFFSFYLLLMPILSYKFDSIQALARKIFIPIAPIALGWLFIGNFVIYALIRVLHQREFHSEFMHGITEIQELNFSIILFLLPFSWMPYLRHLNFRN